MTWMQFLNHQIWVDLHFGLILAMAVVALGLWIQDEWEEYKNK